jgi:hypothetical protein
MVLTFGAHAATINFSGPLKHIAFDQTGGVYSGVSLETIFTGAIDDVSFNGFITDGTTLSSFNSLIAAGGLSIHDDEVLDAQHAEILNAVAGTSRYGAGDVVDSVNIEGDTTTSNGGRIEIGITYVLASDAFDNNDPGNYPLDPDLIQESLYFIFEEDSAGNDIYSAVGHIVPLPASIWLLGAGFLFFVRRRKKKYGY